MSLQITQIRSEIGTTERHRGTLRALGLGKIGRSAVHRDTPEVRGMIRMVSNLVEVQEAGDE